MVLNNIPGEKIEILKGKIRLNRIEKYPREECGRRFDKDYLQRMARGGKGQAVELTCNVIMNHDESLMMMFMESLIRMMIIIGMLVITEI